MNNPFRSRKFLIAFLTILVPLITAFTPDDIDRQIESFAPTVAAVVIAVVAGITIEDSARAWANRPVNSEAATRDMFEEVMIDVFGHRDASGNPLIPPPSNTTVNVHGADTASSESVAKAVNSALSEILDLNAKA